MWREYWRWHLHNNEAPTQALIDGSAVPNHLLGELRKTLIPASDDIDLGSILDRDGYLFLPNLINPEEIQVAREEIFKRLREVDELSDPHTEGVFSGGSCRDELYEDRGKFWESVSAGKLLRQVTNGPKLERVLSQIFGSPAIGFDYLFLRAVSGGKFTHLHCDSGFFTRATEKVLTCWIAFTEITLDKGPLFIVERSHEFMDIRKNFGDFDVMLNKEQKASIDQHPAVFASERNVSLLTSNYNPGDVLIFGMYTLHGAFENHAKDNRIRLTCDIRYQPENEPRDPRYFGINPGGTTGAGYAELNGARPLTEDWHVR